MLNLEFQNTQVTVKNEEIEDKKQEEKNTNLETLAIENLLLYPAFSNDETSYKAEVGKDVQSINILAIPQNETAKVEISGENDLKEGENKVEIVVTAPDGYTKKNFIIKVHKRNAQEESEYEKEQAEKEEKLKQAYEIEKTGAQVYNNGNVTVQNEETQQNDIENVWNGNNEISSSEANELNTKNDINEELANKEEYSKARSGNELFVVICVAIAVAVIIGAVWHYKNKLN